MKKRSFGDALSRVRIHARMEEEFATEAIPQLMADKEHLQNEATIEAIEAQLERVRQLLSQVEVLIELVEDGDDEALERAEKLIQEYGVEKRKGMQEWCKDVQHSRFEKFPTIPHQRPIEKMRFILDERVNDPDTRNELAEVFGFRFEAAGRALQGLQFWEHVGPALAAQNLVQPDRDWSAVSLDLRDPEFSVLFNTVNGGAPIDYEKIFVESDTYPDAREVFDVIKTTMRHNAVAEGNSTPHMPSVMSVPDILMGLSLMKHTEGMPDAIRSEIYQLSGNILDNRISNAERIACYQRLDAIAQQYPLQTGAAEFGALLEAAATELRLPPGHSGRVEQVASLPDADVVVPLSHYDLDHAGHVALSVMQRFPHAFAMPSGGYAPFEIKEDGSNEAVYATEAEAIVGVMLDEQYQYLFAELPGALKPEDAEPIMPYDILTPDRYSYDTRTNAEHILKRLQLLQEMRTHKEVMDVVIVTTDFHSARAWADFRKVIGPDIARIHMVDFVGSPPITDIGTTFKPGGVNDLFCEVAKRLYAVSLDKLPPQ